MKRVFFKQQIILSIFAAAGLVFLLSSFRKNDPKPLPEDLKGTINISGAFALYPITVKWAQEFKKLHPNVVFNISAGGAGKGITDALSGLVELGIELDDKRNTAAGSGARRISTDDSRIAVLVVPTNEELAIARDCAGLL